MIHLDRVLECYAADDVKLTASDVLRIGLGELSGRCTRRGINNRCANLTMTLTESQVEQYARSYKDLPSNVGEQSALEADESLSARLKGKARTGLTLDDLEAVAEWENRWACKKCALSTTTTQGAQGVVAPAIRLVASGGVSLLYVQTSQCLRDGLHPRDPALLVTFFAVSRFWKLRIFPGPSRHPGDLLGQPAVHACR